MANDLRISANRVTKDDFTIKPLSKSGPYGKKYTYSVKAMSIGKYIENLKSFATPPTFEVMEGFANRFHYTSSIPQDISNLSFGSRLTESVIDELGYINLEDYDRKLYDYFNKISPITSNSIIYEPTGSLLLFSNSISKEGVKDMAIGLIARVRSKGLSFDLNKLRGDYSKSLGKLLGMLAKRAVKEDIKKVSDEYVVYPKKGGKRLGTHGSKDKAVKQLQAIEISKNER